MWSFIRRHLDPVDRLGEILFGLIMALGFTGAVRLGYEKADSRALFTGILGCNLAWAAVDGVMYVLAGVFERGRKAHVARMVRAATSDAVALDLIGGEIDGPLLDLTTREERAQLHRWVLEIVRRQPPPAARLHRDDVLGGAAVALVIVLATLPVIAPYLVVASTSVAVRLSNLVALAMLFTLGMRWGSLVGAGPQRIGFGLTAVGLLLVLITIGLGG
jgi:hypothetical protein